MFLMKKKYSISTKILFPNWFSSRKKSYSPFDIYLLNLLPFLQGVP